MASLRIVKPTKWDDDGVCDDGVCDDGVCDEDDGQRHPHFEWRQLREESTERQKEIDITTRLVVVLFSPSSSSFWALVLVMVVLVMVVLVLVL